ncbi:MAG: DUF2284 domain-containing protein [Eubacterium sp.]|nr:DUF2284 domain-containing protein [Eubacterium sp.]MDD7209958.1 DUF2284 domain-containing protein [Lachnospiraceae bacterium]MDY5497812.1 DUF2284 domain-containing protein [Anaerobutyricum sp.]
MNKEEKVCCKTEQFEAEVSVEEYMESCVDVPAFLECCRKCANYEKVWSCPPYDFCPEDYWKKYQTLHIVGIKIYVPEEMLTRTYGETQRNEMMQEIIFPYKKKLDQKLWMMEQKTDGSVALSAGSCQTCLPNGCTRPEGKPCRHPERMRYSIESLGGNVGLTVTKYLKQNLLWMEEGKLPEYFILVGGLLIPA